ncbi:MAG TPA: hypothetical protein DCF72_12440, partial [Gammaproteobacteria bacterium]|nr:hypothetical protein [Gammaproteobacteria bacterium]
QAAQLTEVTVSNRTARNNLERNFIPLSYSCYEILQHPTNTVNLLALATPLYRNRQRKVRGFIVAVIGEFYLKTC